MSELSETVEITNQRGLHARASAKFVTVVSKLPSGVSVEVEKDGSKVNGTSIMGLMMLAAGPGDTIEIDATGPQAAQAVDALTRLVETRFGED